MKTILKIFCLFIPFGLMGQAYTDYLGAGHSEGFTITTSHSMNNAIQHATMGPSQQMIQDLLDSGNDFEAWIDNEFSKPATHTQPEMEDIWDEIVAYYVSQGYMEEDLFGPYKLHFDYAYWETIMTNDDHLRHKVANALSQILVISSNSDL